jgi:hypothetical protein
MLDSNIVSALLGALVGGAASLAGSVLVARRQLTRETRIRMYNELVPALQQEVARYANLVIPPFSEFERHVEALHRAAIIAGCSDSARVRHIELLVADLRRSSERIVEYLSRKPSDDDLRLSIEFLRTQEEMHEGRRVFNRAGDAYLGTTLAKLRKEVEIKQQAYDAELETWNTTMEGYRGECTDNCDAIVSELEHLQRFLASKIR